MGVEDDAINQLEETYEKAEKDLHKNKTNGGKWQH